jgi:hypothetical protein
MTKKSKRINLTLRTSFWEKLSVRKQMAGLRTDVELVEHALNFWVVAFDEVHQVPGSTVTLVIRRPDGTERHICVANVSLGY